MRNNKVYKITISALLCAIGILIPMVSPFKIIIEPASFTLASHVAIIIAMFISPGVAASVALITSFGFLLGGFPITVVLRALSHIIFAYLGAIYLQKHKTQFTSMMNTVLFISMIGVVHAIMEVIFVLPFYVGGNNDIIYSLFVLVGVGTFIHSCIDFIIAIGIFKILLKSESIKKICTIKQV